jgi:putative phosphoserine phosphatase/1-acylglycerol-3-phosphate O-acyltransferase
MVDRKGAAVDAMAEAIAALRAGEVIVMTPEGTIPRGRDFYRTKLKGKTGAARLAAATRVPVIPVGIWGTEKVWPRSSRLPNVTNLLHPPVVRVRVGPPVEGLTYTDPKADTEMIMDAILSLLPEQARQEREPTEEEIARATP